MAVEVTACVDVSEADGLAALDRGTSMAQGITGAPNTPVAVTVFDCGHPSYRLLPTTCLKTHKNTGGECGRRKKVAQTDRGDRSKVWKPWQPLCQSNNKKKRLNSHPTVHFHCSFTVVADAWKVFLLWLNDRKNSPEP